MRNLPNQRRFRIFFCLALSVALILSGNRLAQTLAQTTSRDRKLERQSDEVKVWPTGSKRWALIVGVDQYRDAQINGLRGSVNDAHALANALVNYAGFPPDQVIVLTSDQPEERQPTRINILTYLSNLAALVPKDGLFLFSFAGHGIERNGQAFLIPSDARLNRDISLLEESAVSVNRMHNRIKAIGVGQVIVLLDACRNDPGGRAGAPNNMTAAFTKFDFDVRNREVEAFATLYATAIGQRAYEYTEKKQGYFTWAIVEGLKGAAANEKGEVTLAALLKYVQETVPKRIAINLGPGEQQKPFAIVEGYRADELIVAALPATSQEPIDLKEWFERRKAKKRERASSDVTKPAEQIPKKTDSDIVSDSNNFELAFIGRKNIFGNLSTKYSFRVTNLGLFSNEMFAAAPQLQPCWHTKSSSRTWINVYDENDKLLYEFCGIMSVDGLADLNFILPKGETPPARIYIVLIDRQQKKSYRSAPLVIPRP